MVAPSVSLAPYHPYTCPPRWSRDGRYVYVLAEAAVLRVTAKGGVLEKTGFVLPKVSGTGGDAPYFDVFADGHRLVYGDMKATDQPWLFTDLK